MQIYLIVNTVNGKSYVGQTTQDVSTRWGQHCLLQGKCRVLENAIRKYGARVFEVSVIATVQTQDELNRLERLTCEALKTYAPRGYNLREGGGAKGKMHEQTKRIISSLALSPKRLQAFREMRARPEVLEKLQRAAKNRGPISSSQMRSGRTPATEQRRLASSAKAWATAEVRQAQSERQRVIQARPEVREKRSASIKAAWAAMTDEQRAARAAAVSAGATGVKKKINNSPEARSNRKAAALARWQSPERKAKHAQSMARLHADPEFLKRRGAAIREAKAKVKAKAALES